VGQSERGEERYREGEREKGVRDRERGRERRW